MTKKFLEEKILYLVTNRSESNLARYKTIVTEALKAGVNIVQLREKNITPSEHKIIAKEIKEITDSFHVPLIINDNPIIASEIKAAGVHLGQKDIDINTARKIVGKTAIIGISIENIEQAQQLIQTKVEYAAISPIFSTLTKKNISNPVGIENAKIIRKIIHLPLFAIGGINTENAQAVMSCGLDGICVISAIFDSTTPFETTQRLKQIILSN